MLITYKPFNKPEVECTRNGILNRRNSMYFTNRKDDKKDYFLLTSEEIVVMRTEYIKRLVIKLHLNDKNVLFQISSNDLFNLLNKSYGNNVIIPKSLMKVIGEEIK